MIGLGLFGSVGFEEENDALDITQTAVALSSIGHSSALNAAQTGQFDGGLNNAIRDYQIENYLDSDGVLLPNGPTEASLNRTLAIRRPHRPTFEGNGVDAGTRQSGFNTLFHPIDEPRKPKHNLLVEKDPEATDVLTRSVVPDHKNSSLESEIGSPSEGALGTYTKNEGTRGRDKRAGVAGYRYIPDPMGRIDEGNWVTDSDRFDDGSRLGSDKVRWANKPLGTVGDENELNTVRNPPFGRPASNFRHLARDLETAEANTFRNGRNSHVQLLVKGSHPAAQSRSNIFGLINRAIQESVVEKALFQRASEPNDIASATKDALETYVSGQAERSRIRDMLVEAALNGSTPEQRLHARGLLGVYDMEMRGAKGARVENPEATVDARFAAFAAAIHGGVSWSVYDPNSDEIDTELVDNGSEHQKKPRGMHNEVSRNAALEGRRRHDQLKKRVESKGWKYNKGIRDTEGRVRGFPDVQTPRGFIMEYKPDTPTGRLAGERQCAEYTRITGRPCRVILQKPEPKPGAEGPGARREILSRPTVQSVAPDKPVGVGGPKLPPWMPKKPLNR